jgi:D-arginine dehydrogenase
MEYDVAIVGGGIAGISAAAHLASDTRVIVLEAEPMLGYHATGRSAALYTECYGPGVVPKLTGASRSFFTDGPESLCRPRGVLFVGTDRQETTLTDLRETFAPTVPDLVEVGPRDIASMVPVLDTDLITRGLFEPRAMDLDVNGIEAAFRTMVLDARGHIVLDGRVTSIEALPGGWGITAGDRSVTAAIVVDAAGAWGDHVAAMAGVEPLGLVPLKRSAFIFDPHTDVATWPMVIDAGERWYFKPEGPNILGSAASEISSEPCDARADELDVALGIERINEVSSLDIRSVTSTWAGLRTFTKDRIPAVGFDAGRPDFFWLVGQGGYGIKTSPAVGRIAAGLIVSGAVPGDLLDRGITARDLSPGRFRHP